MSPAPAPQGAAVLELVAVMDRLRSPGGCPWDADQTHASLLRYLVEEAYEVVEAVETGTREDLLEELGDVLLQVVFHARVAAEAADGFDLDDVARGITAKLVRRHPHVFAAGGQDPADPADPADSEASVRTAEDVESRWERAKAVEKNRTSSLDGIPAGLPALARAEKVLDRLARHGVDVPLPTGEGTGDRLLRDVARARESGVSAETELRASLRRYEQAVRDHEQAVRDHERAGRVDRSDADG